MPNTTTVIINTTSSVNFYTRGASNTKKYKYLIQFHDYVFNFIDGKSHGWIILEWISRK